MESKQGMTIEKNEETINRKERKHRKGKRQSDSEKVLRKTRERRRDEGERGFMRRIRDESKPEPRMNAWEQERR